MVNSVNSKPVATVNAYSLLYTSLQPHRANNSKWLSYLCCVLSSPWLEHHVCAMVVSYVICLFKIYSKLSTREVHVPL